ncbi:phosphopentomutase [Candidatus Hakubella thermalkaliphila]|uniref:Phosphopentomutase n=2 Tax=Candidatus Hakubella thermalkaliphila TaxID=2754717 RepID=A0A6V8QA79_9ACTN|nr:phosphopentomutase [Candidatus Hakubella thermalkaliphila]GFP41527.1 phosphopentomutase [Candidatus Hakubella thermalkaliphila]
MMNIGGFVKRVIIIVVDSLGVGELPDAYLYHDEGSNTLVHIAKAMGSLQIPNLESLGLGYLVDIPEIKKAASPLGSYGKMGERSPGKDTTTGHWEMMGIILDRPFPTFPQGFPQDLMDRFHQAIGRKSLGNKVASGTEIIQELGLEHIRTGRPIVYTSADSVFQVAAHEETIPVKELYHICQKARQLLKGEYGVARVIARPFVTGDGKFVRTERRRDFSLPPPKETVLDLARKEGFEVIGIGKIEDIFAGQGLTEAIHAKNNSQGMETTLRKTRERFAGIIMVNLVDFDTLYGHRNDVSGYARALEEFDLKLLEVLQAMREEDVLFVTADHGCDPTTESTDHSREYVPVLIYGEKIRAGVDLGTRESFADLGKTVAELLGVEGEIYGRSFAGEVMARVQN